MDDDELEAQQLLDAAAVHASRRKIDEAIAALAIRPLDEPAADQMRAALASQASARAAIARLHAAATSGAPEVIDLTDGALPHSDGMRGPWGPDGLDEPPPTPQDGR